VIVSMFIFNCCTVGGQSFLIVIPLWLAIIMIANTVNEDHQDSPGHKEERHCRKRIYQHTDFEPSVTCWKPWNWKPKRVFTEVMESAFMSDCLPKHNHTTCPREQSRSDRDRMAKGLVSVGKQNNQEKCQNWRERDEPN